MKKIYIMALAIGAFSISSYAQVDQTEDFEGFALGPISSQSDLWRTWSGEENGPEDGEVSADQSLSGSQALKIDEVGAPDGHDQIYLIDSQPDSGIYTIQWQYYIPSGHEGYFNLQGAISPGSPLSGNYLLDNFYFNKDNATPGQGLYDGNGAPTWDFPQDQWFLVKIVLNFDTRTFSMDVDGVPAITDFPFLVDNTQDLSYFGGVDFYAPSEFTTYYVDDITTAFGPLGTDDFAASSFSVYPNPVKDVLNISSKASVDNVTVYDILGRVVLQDNPDTVSPSINMANLSSGAYLVKVTIGNASKTVKILK